ncbi:hypothetical protein [Paraflavitalea sp. CAU 1676]|uniref:hypothetical protein n=1 Tax=Paraflavitalea sp. CAU 1676 TaxID=3032598 RepID=UPI0023DAA426|nr:hypothetical protein [Paraflavitalea sp. CAU 1676]MDF2187879.1 hypothetical protein [Paraflavitalea sp. CAU 1676]
MQVRDFSEVFWYGGREPEPRSLQLTWLLEFARKYLNVYQNVKPGCPTVELDIVNNSKFEAAAASRDGRYFIGINKGVLEIASNIFNRMLASNKLFIDIGDPTLESETVKTVSTITDSKELDKKEFVVPKDGLRKKFADELCRQLFNFIVFHEYGHICHGHSDFINALNQGEGVIYDMFESGQIDYLDWQTTEMDADSFATNAGVYFLRAVTKMPGLAAQEFNRFYGDLKSAIRIWIFAVYTFNRMFILRNNQKSLFQEHPPHSVRNMLIMNNVVVIAKLFYGEEFSKEIAKVCWDSAVEVEKAFGEISQDGINWWSIRFALQPDPNDLNKLIRHNWNKVRPLLEPFAMVPLPALVNEQ